MAKKEQVVTTVRIPREDYDRILQAIQEVERDGLGRVSLNSFLLAGARKLVREILEEKNL